MSIDISAPINETDDIVISPDPDGAWDAETVEI